MEHSEAETMKRLKSFVRREPRWFVTYLLFMALVLLSVIASALHMACVRAEGLQPLYTFVKYGGLIVGLVVVAWKVSGWLQWHYREED